LQIVIWWRLWLAYVMRRTLQSSILILRRRDLVKWQFRLGYVLNCWRLHSPSISAILVIILVIFIQVIQVIQIIQVILITQVVQVTIPFISSQRSHSTNKLCNRTQENLNVLSHQNPILPFLPSILNTQMTLLIYVSNQDLLLLQDRIQNRVMAF
jgi:hypothetical protein